MTQSEVADRFRQRAQQIQQLTLGVEDWDAPAPVDGWTARDVIDHLISWPAGLLASGAGIALNVATSVADDPALAWQEHQRAVQALLDDPVASQQLLVNPHLGELPVSRALDQFYNPDVFMHSWDLARATGQELELDPQLCAEMLAGMRPLDELLRTSGQFGPAVQVPADASPQDQLMGFIGRDPNWTAPA